MYRSMRLILQIVKEDGKARQKVTGRKKKLAKWKLSCVVLFAKYSYSHEFKVGKTGRE